MTKAGKGKRFTRILLFTILFLATAVFLFFRIHTSVTTNLDNYIYNLPYKEATAHRVVQGYGGLFSHRHIAALDFSMPVGTPVFAAREGTIYSYKDDSNEGGPLPRYQKKANFIIIQHDDGSFGCYWHLQQNGVVVKNGRVEKGQLIGYSGSTGFVLEPHLHFSVKCKLNYKMDSFVRTKFKTTEGITLLQNGKSYKRPGN